MRKASDVEKFPYKNSTNCYIEVLEDGTVNSLPHKNKSDRPNVEMAFKRATADESKLYCVWPGEYSSDLFEVDDFKAFADAFGITYGNSCFHSLTWKVQEDANMSARFVWVDVTLKCGCTVGDSIEQLANFLNEHLGWAVAKSRFSGGHGSNEVTIKVNSSTLRDKRGCIQVGYSNLKHKL